MSRYMTALFTKLRRRSEVTGEREFYVSHETMALLYNDILQLTTRPKISVDRPHAGQMAFVHRLEWDGLILVSTSDKPLLLHQ